MRICFGLWFAFEPWREPRPVCGASSSIWLQMLLSLWLFLFSFSSPLHVFCHRASGFCFSLTLPASVPFLLPARYKKGVKGKAQKKILLSFLIKKMYVQSWFSFTCTKFFFRPLTPFLYHATLSRAQTAAAKFSNQQQKRRSRFSKKIVSFWRGVTGRGQAQPLCFLRSQTRYDARFDDGNQQA